MQSCSLSALSVDVPYTLYCLAVLVCAQLRLWVVKKQLLNQKRVIYAWTRCSQIND